MGSTTKIVAVLIVVMLAMPALVDSDVAERTETAAGGPVLPSVARETGLPHREPTRVGNALGAKQPRDIQPPIAFAPSACELPTIAQLY